jgi:hypothetical protein
MYACKVRAYVYVFSFHLDLDFLMLCSVWLAVYPPVRDSSLDRLYSVWHLKHLWNKIINASSELVFNL